MKLNLCSFTCDGFWIGGFDSSLKKFSSLCAISFLNFRVPGPLRAFLRENHTERLLDRHIISKSDGFLNLLNPNTLNMNSRSKI